MLEPIRWQLPDAYDKSLYWDTISWDGQGYLICPACGWEERFDMAFAQVALSSNEFPCKKCKAQGLKLVRHLEHQIYQCLDCNEHFEVNTTGFETINCPHCSSKRIQLLSSAITPPFPLRFGNFRFVKDEPWGESVMADFEYLQRENQWFNLYPDFPLYLLLAIKFWRRLRLYSNYREQTERALALNIEGGLFREYFRRTKELAAGLASLQLYEDSVRLTEEPIQKALVEHNVAMAIYSILTTGFEDVLNIILGRKNMRQEGIAAALRALACFEGKVEEPFQEQAARIHFSLGDLWAVGHEITDEQLQRAIKHYEQALACPTLPKATRAFVLGARGRTIAKLRKRTPALRRQAIEDLQQMIRLNEGDRAWTDKIPDLSNLAVIYMEDGQPRKACPLLEQAATHVLQELAGSYEEIILQQKGRQYVSVFDLLARVYVDLGHTQRALDAVETLRAATVRLHTMAAKEQAQNRTAQGKSLIRRVIGTLLSTANSPTQIGKLQLQPTAVAATRFIQHVQEIPTAFVTFIGGLSKVTALVILPARKNRMQIISKQWTIDTTQLETFIAQLETTFSQRGTSPRQMPVSDEQVMAADRHLLLESTQDGKASSQETHLRRLSTSAYHAFLAPIIPILKSNAIQRIMISAPGLLSHLPFEAFRPTEQAAFFGNEVEVLYLPSLQLGVDLIDHTARHGQNRLLIVGYADNDLPATRLEVEMLAKSWPHAVVVLQNEQCTKQRVLAELTKDYDYIHFSCHGTFDPLQPLASALYLTRSSVRDRERITAHDLLQLHFQNAPVITLSACSSALTSYDATNDCSGLTGSLLRIGARCVIGSRWPVNDRMAFLFMSKLYRHWAEENNSVQHSFHRIQRELSQHADIEDWAAFGYLGLP